uniref:DUF4485 domain-containing protein n=1 Tax=Glossina brevipalpis TaxID=37001 RepID=A0A1A9W1A4_9MUSC
MNKLNDSNETNDSELKPETLDQVYRGQLAELRELVFRNGEPYNIELCHKWLKRFNKAIIASDKFARNCLCTLMIHQIRDFACFAEPFTNLDNCTSNLESILRDLDEESRTYVSESLETFKSHTLGRRPPPPPPPPPPPNIQGENRNYDIEAECHYNDLYAKTTQLEAELHTLQLQLIEKSIENSRLKDIAERYCFEKDQNELNLDRIKKIILDGIRAKLLAMEETGIRSQINIFEDIFRHYADDEEFMEILRKYDCDFQNIFAKYFKLEFDKRKSMIGKHLNNKLKMRDKYERRIFLLNISHELDMKLAKLHCFSIVRQIFIKSHNEFGTMNMWDMLKNFKQYIRTSLLSLLSLGFLNSGPIESSSVELSLSRKFLKERFNSLSIELDKAMSSASSANEDEDETASLICSL